MPPSWVSIGVAPLRVLIALYAFLASRNGWFTLITVPPLAIPGGKPVIEVPPVPTTPLMNVLVSVFVTVSLPRTPNGPADLRFNYKY